MPARPWEGPPEHPLTHMMHTHTRTLFSQSMAEDLDTLRQRQQGGRGERSTPEGPTRQSSSLACQSQSQAQGGGGAGSTAPAGANAAGQASTAGLDPVTRERIERADRGSGSSSGGSRMSPTPAGGRDSAMSADVSCQSSLAKVLQLVGGGYISQGSVKRTNSVDPGSGLAPMLLDHVLGGRSSAGSGGSRSVRGHSAGQVPEATRFSAPQVCARARARVCVCVRVRARL